MKNKKVNILSIVIVVLLAGYTKGCAYLPISGTVVDAETGKPIEGAVVLVEWTIKKGIGDKHTESVKVAEVLTDKDGKFDLPGCYQPFVEAPDLTIYKRGYVAWNNKYIFRDGNRADFTWQSSMTCRVAILKTDYSYEAHMSFIRGLMLSGQLEQKKLMIKAIDWEEEKAFEERQLRR